MEDQEVREHADAHGQAMVAGDLARAAQDLTDEAKAAIRPVMAALPRPVTSASVESVRSEGDEHIAVIRYSGEESEAMVESRWGDVDGRPMILATKLL